MTEFDYINSFIKILKSEGNEIYKISVLRILLQCLRSFKEIADNIIKNKQIYLILESYINQEDVVI